MLERRTIEDLIGLLKTSMGECRLLHSNEKEHVQTIFALEKERSDLRLELEALKRKHDMDPVFAPGPVVQEAVYEAKVKELEQQRTEARDALADALIARDRLQDKVEAQKRDVCGFEEQVGRLTEQRDAWKARSQAYLAESAARDETIHTLKGTIGELEARLREGNPDYAQADIERKALRAAMAEAHAILDTTGTPGEDAQGDCIPLVERLEDWARVFKEAKEQLGYSEAAVPDPVDREEGS